MTDGSGAFDKNKFLKEYPKALEFDYNEASKIVEDVAKRKIKSTLVEAIAFHRQNKGSEVARTMQNYLSQFRAFPQSVHWDCKEDIVGVYMDCVTQFKSEEIHKEIASALGLEYSHMKAFKLTPEEDK